MKKNRNNATRWDNTGYTRPFAPMGSTGTMAGAHTALYNGNIAHTTNSLQPFGGWSGTGQSAQVLAQVYKYDQLNRLKTARGYTGLDADNDWALAGATVTDMYKSTYAYDANGNITEAHRWDQHGERYDSLYYHYHEAGGHLVRNRLYHLQDLAPDNVVTLGADGVEDLPYTDDAFNDGDGEHNTLNNYRYDALGNLIRDEREEIASIEWTVAGKVKRVERTTGSGREPLTFGYGADGQRIMKQVGENPDLGTGHREYYVRDAQGNIMAIYRYTNTGTASFRVMERPIYGSSRLGSYDRPRQLLGSQNIPAVATMSHAAKRYELTDHLGNVSTVVTGRLLSGNNAGSPFQAEVVSAQGYEAFGSLLPGRNYSSDSYRFGFQGQEKDDEIHGSTGTSYAFKYRMHDARVGRFWSIDPLASKYPHNSPYAFSENRVIDAIELEGLEAYGLNGFMGQLKAWSGYDDSRAGDQKYEREFLGKQTKLVVQSAQQVKNEFVEGLAKNPQIAILAAPVAIVLGPEIAAAATTDVALSGVGLQLLDMGSEFGQQYVSNGFDASKTDVADVLIQGLPSPILENALQAGFDYAPFDRSKDGGFKSVLAPGAENKSIGAFLLEGTLGSAQGVGVKGLFDKVPGTHPAKGTVEKKFDFITGTAEKGMEKGLKQATGIEEKE